MQICNKLFPNLFAIAICNKRNLIALQFICNKPVIYWLMSDLMYTHVVSDTDMSYVPKLYPKLVKTFCCCFLQEVPEIPGNFDLVGHSSRQANLSWNLPYDGQSPLLAFQLEFQRTNTGKGCIYLVVKYTQPSI